MSFAAFCLVQCDRLLVRLTADHLDYKRRLLRAVQRDDLVALYVAIAKGGPAWQDM